MRVAGLLGAVQRRFFVVAGYFDSTKLDGFLPFLLRTPTQCRRGEERARVVARIAPR